MRLEYSFLVSWYFSLSKFICPQAFSYNNSRHVLEFLNCSQTFPEVKGLTEATLGNFTDNWTRGGSLKHGGSIFPRNLELELRDREWTRSSHLMCLELQHMAWGAVGAHLFPTMWNKEQRRWVCWDKRKWNRCADTSREGECILSGPCRPYSSLF